MRLDGIEEAILNDVWYADLPIGVVVAASKGGAEGDALAGNAHQFATRLTLYMYLNAALE